MSLLPKWFPPKFKVDSDLADAFDQSQRAWSKPDPHTKKAADTRSATGGTVKPALYIVNESAIRE